MQLVANYLAGNKINTAGQWTNDDTSIQNQIFGNTRRDKLQRAAIWTRQHNLFLKHSTFLVLKPDEPSVCLQTTADIQQQICQQTMTHSSFNSPISNCDQIKLIFNKWIISYKFCY